MGFGDFKFRLVFLRRPYCRSEPLLSTAGDRLGPGERPREQRRVKSARLELASTPSTHVKVRMGRFEPPPLEERLPGLPAG